MGTRPLIFEGEEIVPRRLLFELLKPLIDFPNDPRDLCLIRTRCAGVKDGRPAVITFELIDFYDPETGFSSMERMTGFPAALAAIMVAKGKLEPGAKPMEITMPTDEFIAGLLDRGFRVEQQVDWVE